MRAKYPFIEVILDITGPDGNVFKIMRTIQREMKRAGIPQEEIDKYMEESSAGDYEEALATARRWVTFRTGRLMIVPIDDHDYSPTPEQQLGDDILDDMEEVRHLLGEGDLG